MNQHQVLTGAVNPGDYCYSVGSVEGVPFTVYAAGCNIVILSSELERVQIIAGICHGNVQVTSLDCSNDVGKIAAAYGKKISIFEPSPLLNNNSAHKLDYRWVETASVDVGCHVKVISWNISATRLLIATEANLELWNYLPKDDTAEGVKFTMGAEDEEPTAETSPWLKSWQIATSSPVHFLKFANDGTMFATAGRNDRLAKVWYETCDANGDKKPQQKLFNFVYLPHPRAVTALSWRHTSKYMPRGCVANMLVTSCKDNICRLWSQTLLPEDGLINLSQIEALSSQQPKVHRHRNKIMSKLKHIKSLSEHKARNGGGSLPGGSTVGGPNGNAGIVNNGALLEPMPSMPSSFSINDFHNFAPQGSGVAPGVHFHLAASINAESDIPLVPAMRSDEDRADDAGGHFVLHWLNNKEICFSRGAERLLHDVSVKAFQDAIRKQQEAEEAEQSKPEPAEEAFLADEGISDRSPTVQSKDGKISHSDSSASNGSGERHSSLPINVPKDADHSLGEALENKLEVLLKQWHKTSDLLFSVHPIDGSFLVWIVDFLDESIPGAFRQPQVSFNSRISNAIALGDAATMSQNISLYLPTAGLDLKTVLRGLGALESPPGGDATKDLMLQAKEWTCTPTVSMISKHSNGSLNLWYLTFKDEESLTHVLSVTHSNKRVCGHRFRINDITCHPVLPLLLTTSHHNSPQCALSPVSERISGRNGGFCSELILWKVESVGPLSKSGGISELARINSLHLSAFSNVAWIPTLLPSSTLGTVSNSPSACFVASDGTRLRVYQALIDARSLLAELVMARKRQQQAMDTMSVSSAATSISSVQDGPGDHRVHGQQLLEGFKIVSLQSTARPGCIIELDAITDAVADWQHTQLLHVFQESLILGGYNDSPLQFMGPGKGVKAYVDLQHAACFREPFYLVVIEKKDRKSILHMWKLTIASTHNQNEASQREQAEGHGLPETINEIVAATTNNKTNQKENLSDTNPFVAPNDMRDSHHSSRSSTPDRSEHSMLHASPLKIVTEKLCEHELPLPDGVEIVHAEPAAGHLSSSNIYPACLAPYLITTACSDGKTRFWKCSQDEKNSEINGFQWVEWRMVLNTTESAIDVDGSPLAVSAAYSGRVAVAFKLGSSFTRPTKGSDDARYVNLAVAIYECESTGGSEWVLEDTIRFRNVQLPRIYCGGGADDVDLPSIYDANLRNRVQMDHIVQKLADSSSKGDLSRMLSVPSYATLQTLKKSIIEQGNQCVLIQKSLMQLDWVSSEDGSHILTVALGPKVMLYAPVSYDIAQCNAAPSSTSASTGSSYHRPLLKQRSSMAPQVESSRLRWMQIRGLELRTADGLPALPMQLSWVRDGILVVGMDNEMHIYSQWKPHKRAFSEDNVVHKNTQETFSDPSYTKRCLHEDDLMSRVQETQLRIGSSANLTRNPSLQVVANAAKVNDKAQTPAAQTGGAGNVAGGHSVKELLPDFGLFETSRLACPVLPQYHPKQLMELLAFGKIKRVRAILAHLVRCLKKGTGREERQTLSQDSWSKSRAYSLAAPPGTTPQLSPGAGDKVFTEEVHLDYVEITSIPPLPLYKLLEADTQVLSQEQGKEQKAKSAAGSNGGHESNADQTDDYSLLFDDATDNFNALNEDSSGRTRTHSASERTNRNPNHFGTQQANILTQVLTHCSLPGLSSLDQVHLLALADSIASFQSSITERFSQNVTVSMTKHDSHHSAVNVEAATEALDDSGLRYLLATRHHTYLMRCLPLSERASLQKQGLAPHSIVWAFHSETQDELIQLVLNQNNLKWTDLKDLGVGWWCKNNTSLKKLIERVAKSAFQAQQNPLDASFYYMALKKKNILTGLFRSVNDKKMTEFFQNNFNEDRWRRAALKNAYALLGKQKFQHAAAFFLLANDLKSAVQVCLNNLDDLQLAMILVRLYDGGEVETYPDSLKPMVYTNVLGCNERGDDCHSSQAHPDPFIRSMAFWILKRYEDALSTLLQTDIGCAHAAYREPSGEGKETAGSDPAVFNFYLYLRTHPFVVRRNLARLMKDRRQSRAIMLSGFNSVAKGEDSHGADTITPLERRLFFTTAHAHFRAGCPPLALEVLSRLPNCQLDPDSADVFTSKEEASPLHVEKEEKAEDFDWSMPVVSQKASAFDWSQPVSQKAEEYDWSQPETEKADAFDWSQPVSNSVGGKAEDFDWSQPASNTQQSNGLDGNSCDRKVSQFSDNEKSATFTDAPGPKGSELIDVMAQQLKFIACLKIMMEELSTLATGLEVDGGLLRFQLYVWLEKCVAALRQLCHYGANETKDQLVGPGVPEAADTLNETVKLHDVLLQDKKDFEDKLDRAARRKHWLKANEALLRTLLSYSALHGAHGGGLAAVRMELNLLLQELQQTRTPQALLASPLPVPTSLPLLAASVASNKTVVADPVRHVQSLAHDILQTITQDLSLQLPQRGELAKVLVLRDLCLSLSACIYQALCDSDKLPTRRSPRCAVDEDNSSQAAILGGALHGSLSLLTPQTRERLSSASAGDLLPTSAPSKWPGVPSLRALMARDRDDDAPKLHTLLCEAFVGVYVSLMVHALATRDSHVLFRLVSHKMTDEMWAALFGGGAKKVLKVYMAGGGQGGLANAVTGSASAQNKTPTHSSVNAQATSAGGESSPDIGILDAINRQRLKWNMKILPQFASEKPPTSPPAVDRNETRPAYKEVFVAPTESIAARLLSKPHLEENLQPVDYDSSENVEEEEVEDDWKDDVFDDKSADSKSQQGREGKETKAAFGDSAEEQFAWGILSLSVLKLVLRNVMRFLETAGIDFGDLPVASPLMHASLKALQHWYTVQRDQLDKGLKTADLLPNMVVDSFVNSGPAIHKYKVLLELDNTPFQRGSSASALRAARRLWNYLVRQEDCQEYFIKYIFSPPKRQPLMLGDSGAEEEDENTAFRPIRVIHKDQESISAFCVNRCNGNTSIITVATPKDMQELDISGLRDDVGWLDNEAEFDILNRGQDAAGGGGGEYLVVEHPIDRQLLGPAANPVGSHASTPLAPLPSNSIISSVHSHGKSNINLKNLHFPGSQHPQFCEFVLSRSRLMVKTRVATPSGKPPLELKRHKVDSVRRLASHPSASLYLSGGQDGAVQLWEWGHSSAVCALRLPGTRAKVTSVSFNPQGNKLGVTDGDGVISLWQVGVARIDQNPFFTTQCHSKQASEFAFAGSSSLLATGGQSSDGRNVCLWDTLLPQRKAMIGSFHCHEHGCSALLYAPHSGLLISAGKKGDIAIIDVRQRVLQHKFLAHDSAVKCLSLDPNEEFFVSGSADGDIKIWSLPVYALQHSFKGEHSKNSLFRSMASGVTNLYVDEQARLFSCGADGSLKLRQLPKKDPSVVQLAPY